MSRSIHAALGCALLLAVAGPVSAQSASSDKFFLNVNLGYQTQSRDLAGGGTYTIYEEDATFSTSQTIKSGLIFDVNAGYEVAENFAIGVGWTTFSKTSSVNISAQVPHPAFVGQFRTVTGEADAKHSANAININAVWRYPVSGKADVIVSAGPSIVKVSQDVATGITIKPEAWPFPPPELDTVTVSSESKTTVGFNAGVDFAYMLDPRYGVGAGLRYTFASADIPGLDDNVKVGGLQLLFGARLRF